MKIAFVTEHFNPRFGGQEVYMRDFSTYLLDKGHEVSFFTQDSNVNDPRLKINLINLPFYGRLSRWGQWYSFLKLVKKQLNRDSFDVVMGTGISAGINVYQPHGGVSKASHRQNRLLVSPVHGFLKGISNFFSPKHIMAKRVEEKIFNDQKIRFIAISEMVKGHMQEFYKIPDDRIKLIYNGVDIDRFRPCTLEEKLEARKRLGLSEDKTIFSLVAHNFKLKGLKEIIAAVERVSKVQKDFVVFVAGKGKQAIYKKMILKKGLQDFFIFAGSVDEPEFVYRASDIYLQPTWYDPCSLVVLEAMASGLPVITSAFNGASEMIEHGRNGWIIPRPDDLELFCDGMHEYMDKQKRDQVGVLARAAVEGLTHYKNFEEMEKVFLDFK